PPTSFSVFDGVLLRPLPWPRADRLVRLTETHAGATRELSLLVTNTAFRAMNDHPSTVEELCAWSGSTAIMMGVDGVERVQTASVTPSTFPALRAPPRAGGVFTADDAPEVVLSYGLWHAEFGGAPDAIGRAMTLNGQSVTVVGVMPAEFEFPDPNTRLWRPFRVPAPPALASFAAMARLRDGATPGQAAEEATSRARNAPVATNALLAMFGSTGDARIRVEPALDGLTRGVRPGILALFAAASLLLVMAVANLAPPPLPPATTPDPQMAIPPAPRGGRDPPAPHVPHAHIPL